MSAPYADRFLDELDDKPFDRKMLDWLGERAAPVGPICDMGCGPGQAAAYLQGVGVAACGIDVSPAMVRRATTAHPTIHFEQGDMRALTGVGDAAYGGIVSFWSIVNLGPAERPIVFQEFHRVLRDRGWLLISFHIGDGPTRVTHFLGRTVDLDFHFIQPGRLRRELSEAGFQVTELIERAPYFDSAEAPTRRGYVFGRKTSTLPERARDPATDRDDPRRRRRT